MCIWRWKRDLFTTQNPSLADSIGDASLPFARRRIQAWIDATDAHPREGDADEYGHYAERAYPIAEDRRRFFERLAIGARPFVGYRLLALLAEEGLFGSAWTTNFDGLVPRAAAATSLPVIEVGLDTSDRVDRAIARGELLHVALHGDYRYDSLKNVANELRDQDERLRRALISAVRDASLLVVGYSGRDASVMEALEAGYREQGKGRLYWCMRADSEPSSSVLALLRLAQDSGREARLVRVSSFDDLMTNLARHALAGERAIEADRVIHESSVEKAPAAFEVVGSDYTDVIKSNAFPIELPGELLQASVQGFETDAWKKVRALTADRAIVAGLHRGKVLALGTSDDVRDALGSHLTEPLARVPIDPRDTSRDEGVVVSILTEALVRSIGESCGLPIEGRELLWNPESEQERTVLGQRLKVHDACILALRRYANRSYLVLKPTIHVLDPNGTRPSIELDQEAKRQVLGRQWNQAFNQAVEEWRKRLFGRTNVFDYPPGASLPYRFVVTRVPAFAAVNAQAKRAQPPMVDVARLIAYRGIEVPEPRLVFRSRSGTGPAFDSHPIRGVVSNRPYDHGLVTSGLAGPIRVGVICPGGDDSRLSPFLDAMHQPRDPETKAEYLLPYPGFASAFGTALEVGQPGGPRWMAISEPSVDRGDPAGGPTVARAITSAIDRLVASADCDVVVIYIPSRWLAWRAFRTETESFDLHDFVKAYAVQRGISTQFLEEQTIRKPQQCEIRWWLALSFYVKSMRTPWTLEPTESDVAFVGIGFSVNSARRRTPIVVGCSHIYGADGLGLRYRLTKLEDPILRGRDPFMSREDARRVGENIRQLFYESRQRLPGRVVIHKQTPFLNREKEGLLDGLSGVGDVELLQVTIEPMLRWVASRVVNGSLQGHGFPVGRGTAVVLDRSTALVWVHGSTSVVGDGRTYYQGKSRIPAPLVVRRFLGSSPLPVTASELLALSKMNWNTFDLYTKLPATIASSRQIAAIGSLLERFSARSYDYRLFI